MKKIETGEINDALDKIRVTSILREGSLGAFLFAVILLELTEIYNFYDGKHLLMVFISLWLITSFIFRSLVKKQKTTRAISDIYFYYAILLELPILSVIVYLLGGIEWLGLIFFFFPIVFTSIFFSKTKALLITTIASIFYVLLVLLPFFDLIPFQAFYPLGRELHEDPNFVSISLLCSILAFYLLSIAANIPTGLLKEKTLELTKTKRDLEKERKTLEDKVAERTNELNKEKNKLEDKVQDRTKDLQERVGELESFHELTTGRELKMVELKKEIEEKDKMIKEKDEKIEELEEKLA